MALQVRVLMCVRIALLALGLVVAGCSVPLDDMGEAMGGSPTDAGQIVEEWLAEAQSGKGDLGWSRLYPNVREEMLSSYEAYKETVLAADWSRFDYNMTEVRTHDGAYLVVIRVPGGERSTPAFMLDWGIVQFPRLDGVPTDDGLITVRIPPLGGDRGIQAAGGPG
jgi:hypothetical protein